MTSPSTLTTFACFAGVLVSFICSPAAAQKTSAVSEVIGSRPNVVVVFMDDMAYGDIGAFGATEYPTPNLDALAQGGRRFTDFVVSSAVCSASRSALMTGCYHRRVGLSGALGPKSNIGLDPAETTIAEVCKSVGYRTACFGKWHLGHHEKFLPHNQGFDQFYGIPYSNDMWPLHPDTIRRQKKDPTDPGNWPPLPIMEAVAGSPVKIVNDNVQPADQEQMTVELTRRSVEFIEDKSSDDPFFLYLPHPMVHVPLYVSDRFRGKSGVGLFGDVMMEVDWSIGQIMSAIKNAGQEENTLVVFTSDNGPWLSYGDHAGSTRGLREGKGTMWEGGYREPCLMHWPGTIPAGTTCDKLASTIDLLPTIARLAGAELPERTIDGKPIVDLMLDVPGAVSPHTSFAGYYGGGQLQIVRNERFKLVFPHRYRTLNGRPGGTGGMPTDYSQQSSGFELYDLENDVSETTNVMDQYPDVVVELQAAAEQYRVQLGDSLQKRVGQDIRGPGKL
ncbi:sulfatase family protein [Neorhodopirellula pilleata]|uniref:Arylsulfatase n=1 Tax=Neorhodopirellula pilleata TaxID=2714738 RepID=A0A5C6AW81_9BACT|nr:sulfatase [Neorhodopirellula pilleata]TWU04000.1 Arylsulfatase [Neorhodopirellula pilleata]